MAIAAEDFALPLTVRGPRGWARHGMRLGKDYQLLDADENLLAKVQLAARKREGLLSFIEFNNSQELFMVLPIAGNTWELAWSARTLGLGGGEIRQYSEPENPDPNPSLKRNPSSNSSVDVGFTGTRVLLAGDSVDKPDPLRPGWRFWIQGARFAEAEAVGQHEVRITALDADETQRLAAPLLLAWLLGIVLTEAAAA